MNNMVASRGALMEAFRAQTVRNAGFLGYAASRPPNRFAAGRIVLLYQIAPAETRKMSNFDFRVLKRCQTSVLFSKTGPGQA